MRHPILATGILVLLAACEALPNVDYALVDGPKPPPTREIASYALQESVVRFELKKIDQREKVTIKPGRRDHQRVRIALIDAGNWGVNTDVSIVKFDNTDIPKEVVVKVEDHRKELIEKAGAVIVAGLKSGLFPFSALGDIAIPVTVNISALLSTPNRDAQLFQLTGEGLSVQIDKAPADAIAVDDLSSAEPGPYFYYGACRTATLIFRYQGLAYEETVKITDPNFLQRVRMPFDGKIEMHTQCGASVTGKLTSDESARNLDLINALLIQGKSIKEALDAASGDD